MKRIIALLLLSAAVLVVLSGCGSKPPATPPPPPPVQVDTTPVTPPPPPPAEEPKPTLQESQFQTVYFDFDKYNLRADAKAALDADFALLQEFPDAIVKIEGHCDERGTVEYNLSLGEKRAKAVMDYLVGKGVAAARLSSISYGKERPVDPGHNETAWAKNRRAEFKVISQ
jgi:peptidoglycan-associated lipoprotein